MPRGGDFCPTALWIKGGDEQNERGKGRREERREERGGRTPLPFLTHSTRTPLHPQKRSAPSSPFTSQRAYPQQPPLSADSPLDLVMLSVVNSSATVGWMPTVCVKVS